MTFGLRQCGKYAKKDRQIAGAGQRERDEAKTFSAIYRNANLMICPSSSPLLPHPHLFLLNSVSYSQSMRPFSFSILAYDLQFSQVIPLQCSRKKKTDISREMKPNTLRWDIVEQFCVFWSTNKYSWGSSQYTYNMTCFPVSSFVYPNHWYHQKYPKWPWWHCTLYNSWTVLFRFFLHLPNLKWLIRLALYLMAILSKVLCLCLMVCIVTHNTNHISSCDHLSKVAFVSSQTPAGH